MSKISKVLEYIETKLSGTPVLDSEDKSVPRENQGIWLIVCDNTHCLSDTIEWFRTNDWGIKYTTKTCTKKDFLTVWVVYEEQAESVLIANQFVGTLFLTQHETNLELVSRAVSRTRSRLGVEVFAPYVYIEESDKLYQVKVSFTDVNLKGENK